MDKRLMIADFLLLLHYVTQPTKYDRPLLHRNYQYVQPELPLLSETQQSEETAHGRRVRLAHQ